MKTKRTILTILLLAPLAVLSSAEPATRVAASVKEIIVVCKTHLVKNKRIPMKMTGRPSPKKSSDD